MNSPRAKERSEDLGRAAKNRRGHAKALLNRLADHQNDIAVTFDVDNGRLSVCHVCSNRVLCCAELER